MSLFPYIDKEVQEINKAKREEFKEWVQKQEVFTPSNGSEAMLFDSVCIGCSKYDTENPKCNIEFNFWCGSPQKEILQMSNGWVMCISHSKIESIVSTYRGEI